ncbi:50S ribosomal protein L10 [Brachyspira hyodysenteriae]|uniref:50S ribosomal protein L10 n=1 Tax=Brachyspira hyodysenteriae TaxID=159 RepID=UPI0022CD4FF7|nr:50S ribosomal protein L10 [Brachyspira hyodysenteriae]MCZ9928343.1 50S ribosomal protein L10 [Brachyspira hyodysenteriae]MCZ9979599.1 50S ribosomal protein L10 [Brachyspira hyodysenteriae]MCZ9995624.1 50S ribosomal protein L10 [Brachyspira hyodysenteriae]MDA0042267.1 50S ribosomal protein L10 [Brachyspira hyodysenteriae]MDA0058113.1 50S ribosomal protein L10 [Brachyspira hyodysenteriae]
MPNKKNIETVSLLKETMGGCAGLVFFDYRGVTVAQLTELRLELAKTSSSMKICKNSLVDIALKELGREVKDEMFVNPTAVVFAKEDVPSAAKVISEASKKNDKIKIKGGYMGEDLLNPADVQVVANIPPREVLLSHLVTALESPISSLANSLQSVISELAYVLDSVEEEKKKSA